VLQGGRGASSAHDGKSIYYLLRGRIWRASADGDNHRQLTDRPGGAPVESPDGKFVYFRLRGTAIWRVPADGGREEPAVEADGPVVGDPIVTANGIYYLTIDRVNRFDRSILLAFYDFKTRQTSVAYHIRFRAFGYTPLFSVSPDGKYLLYARTDQSATNLMYVANFK
jgi:Tol biopolymer transport system component